MSRDTDDTNRPAPWWVIGEILETECVLKVLHRDRVTGIKCNGAVQNGDDWRPLLLTVLGVAANFADHKVPEALRIRAEAKRDKDDSKLAVAVFDHLIKLGLQVA